MTISDETIIRALISSSSVTDAARQADCSRTTIYSRLKSPEFVAKAEEAKQTKMKAFLLTRSSAIEDAADALIDIVRHNPDDNLRIKAADALLRRFW